MGCLAAPGKSGSRNRKNPYVPIFRSTAARTTDPGVGASTWASGSQVCSGKTGTFTANARANALKSQSCSFMVRGTWRRSAYANVGTPRSAFALKNR